MIKNMLINLGHKLGIISFYDYWEYNKQQLIKKGLVCGENVHILGSNIDDEYCSIISIGNNVTITRATVLAHDASTKKFLGYSKVGSVSIGNNVFVGYGSIILPGTVIADNCIIGAGSVIRGSIPPDSLVIGNPSQIVGSVSSYIKKNSERLERLGAISIRKEDDIKRFWASGGRGYDL